MNRKMRSEGIKKKKNSQPSFISFVEHMLNKYCVESRRLFEKIGN